MDTNPADHHGQSDDQPWSPNRAAAAVYRQRWGWPVHASGDAVWLLLPMTMAAISIHIRDRRRAELRSVLDSVTGPIIDYTSGRYVILTRCTVLNAEHIGSDQHDSPVVHLGPNNFIDLPPSIVAGAPAIWLHAPVGDHTLPDCVTTLTLARNLLAGQ